MISAAEPKDCSCPKVSCGPCQKKINTGKVVKFCDWGDINVCRKEICENVNFYFKCLSNKKNKTDEPEKKLAENNINFLYEKGQKESDKKQSKSSGRSIASKKAAQGEELSGRIEVGNDSRVIIEKEYSTTSIGQAQAVSKGLRYLHRGQHVALGNGRKLYVEDEILNQAKKDKKLSIVFANGKVDITLKPKSKLIVQDPESIVGRFQPFLYLVHGGVDYQVTLEKGSFDLLAGQILSRSNGGQHSVKYQMGQEGLNVKVESYHGALNVIRAQDLSGKVITVGPGNFLSWVSETPAHLFTTDEKQALAAEGFITPVFEMTEVRKRQLGLVKPIEKLVFSDWKSEDKKRKVSRDIASVGVVEDLCQSPTAGYQQCAWSCEGNSKNSKSCEAEKANIHCVRRVCNAAGEWGVPTAFATSYKDLCPAQGVRVGDCQP